MIEGKVLITGGTGFLGRAIMRYAMANDWDCDFTVFSRDEAKQAEIRRTMPGVKTVLGDVRDIDSLYKAFVGHDVVIHAAAMKYIPTAEENVQECVTVNITGTQNVIHAAIAAEVKEVMGISTDKAAEAINLYGMTKAVLEKLFQEAATYSDYTEFHLCRYGNVVGSTGSVVPLWKQQFADRGRITVTDPEMTRFWMSAFEAVEVIERAFRLESGDCFIPKCKSMTIADMANAVVPDAQMEEIGIRPGEKRHEILLGAQESYWAVEIDEGYVLRPMTTEPMNFLPHYRSDLAESVTGPEFEAMMKLGEKI